MHSVWSQISKKYNYRFFANGRDDGIYIYDNETSVRLGIITRNNYGIINYEDLINLIDDYLIDIRDSKIESILK